MTDSSPDWNWVNQMHLPSIRDVRLRNQLAYLAAITRLVQMSTARANTWSNTTERDTNAAEIRELRETLAEDDDFVVLLLQGLLAASIALPAAYLVSEFMAISYGVLKKVEIRSTAWNKKFGDRRYGDATITPSDLRDWEKSTEEAFKVLKDDKVVKSLTSGAGRALTDGVTTDAITLLLYPDGPTPLKDNDPARAKTTIDNYWTRITLPATMMERRLTYFAKVARDMQELDIPVWGAAMPDLMRSGERLLPTSEKWLTTELESILQPVDSTDWKDLDIYGLTEIANERLAHIWFFEYIALFMAPAPRIDSDYFNKNFRSDADQRLVRLLGGPADETPFRDAGTREIPYKVHGTWYTTKLTYSSGERARAEAIVHNLRHGPGYEESYLTLAAKAVTVTTDRWVDRGPLGGYLIDSPDLADARIDYAYLLLAKDIHQIRTRTFTTKMREETVLGSLPPKVLDALWLVMGLASPTVAPPRGHRLKRPEVGRARR